MLQIVIDGCGGGNFDIRIEYFLIYILSLIYIIAERDSFWKRVLILSFNKSENIGRKRSRVKYRFNFIEI